MIRRQRDDYDQNKIIHIKGTKENLSFIISRMILIQKKKVMAQALCRERVLLNRILNRTCTVSCIILVNTVGNYKQCGQFNIFQYGQYTVH